jgi:hypothetical protein
MKTLTYLNNSTVHSRNINYPSIFFYLSITMRIVFTTIKKENYEKDFDSRIELRLVLKKKFFFSVSHI